MSKPLIPLFRADVGPPFQGFNPWDLLFEPRKTLFDELDLLRRRAGLEFQRDHMKQFAAVR